MATFVSLINFTDQGIRNIKKSPHRAEQFKQLADTLGVTVKQIFWTVGHYDVVAVIEGSDKQVTTALLTLGALGNARTQTLRAFNADEFNEIIQAMP